jgi:integrase
MNIRSLKWSYIDFHNKILYLPETKSGAPHQIPLTDCAVNVLNDIKNNQTDNQSEYVFATNKGRKGYITCPKKFWQGVLNKAGILNLRIHDLRRTMGSYQAITGSSLQVIGKSLGHKSTQSTSVYARLNLDAVRNSMQKATNEMRKILNC